MNQVYKNDMVSFNFYCRNRLKKSLTYTICNGNFKNVRTLLEQPDETNDVDVNETDSWWNPAARNSPRGRSASSHSISIYNNYINAEIDDLKIILPLVRHKTTMTNQPKKTVGRTSLMLCSLIEDQEWAFTIMQNLIEKGAFMHFQDSNGHNALMYACLYQRSPLLELLLNASGDCNLYDKDIFGNTVFHLASIGQSEQNCFILNETFMKYQTSVMNKMIRNHLGHTPYDLCKTNGHYNCIKNLYPGINDKNLTFRSQSSHIGIDSSLDDLQSDQELAKLPKLSNASLFATILAIDEPNILNVNINVNSGPKKNPLTSKTSIQEYYKPLFVFKEALIKKNTLYFDKDVLESQKSFINFSKSARRQSTSADIRSVTYRLIESNSMSRLNQSSMNIDQETSKINTPKLKQPRQKSIESNWKSNMRKILDVIESSKTKSFRASNKNLSTNLFDQIANGILLKVTNPGSESPSRRNSLFRRQQNSALSQTGNDQTRRQSIASSIGKGSKSQSRRPSITV